MRHYTFGGRLAGLPLLFLSLAAPSFCATPAERAIERAQRMAEKNPGRPEPHNALAIALARRARETSDTVYYQGAEKALRESFRLAPDNLEGRKTEVWVLLGNHEFGRALEGAKTLQQRAPRDPLVYGLLTDANIELGNYSEAAQAAQQMLDLQPGIVPALTRAAYVREMLGNIDGAIELMQAGYRQLRPMRARTAPGYSPSSPTSS